jgi:hypothetical protein
MPPVTEAQTAATDANSQPASAAAPAPTAAPSTLLTDAPAPAAAAPAAQPAQPASDAKPAEGTPPADAKPADDKPIEYADFTAPEGVTLNPEAMTELKAFAAERKLSQEDAQKLVDLGAKTMQQQQAALTSQIEQAQAQWSEASRTDKEFGGDKLAENVAVAKQALDQFGSPELSKMLKESGLGNHPEIIRAFFRVGKAISEDKVERGTTKPANASDDLAKKMYPTMTN